MPKISANLVYDFSYIEKKYNITILTDDLEVVPELWKLSPIYGYASQLKETNYKKSIKILDRALNEYLPKILTDNLIEIAICDSLSFYGKSYTGTMIASNNYLRVFLVIDDFTTIEEGVLRFHENFFKLLSVKFDFPIERWKSLNKPGFRYNETNLNLDRNLSMSMLSNGFISQYSQNSFLQDAADIAKYAIGDKTFFLKLYPSYPIITLKYQLIKEFYYSINQYLDSSFWKGQKVYLRYVKDYENDPKDKRFVSLKFYESNKKSQFSKEFVAKKACYIGYYLTLKSIGSGAFVIKACYYYPDETLMGTFSKKFYFDPYSQFVNCTALFGWEDPGYWIKGDYFVIFYINDSYLTTGSFTMK